MAPRRDSRALALGCVLVAAVGCGADALPPPAGGGGPQVPGGPRPADAAADATGDAGDAGADVRLESIACAPLPATNNLLLLSGGQGAMATSVQLVYATCDQGELRMGFDEDTCGLGSGVLAQVNVPLQAIRSGAIVPFLALEISLDNGLGVRVFGDDGTVWGDCVGSSGTLRFTQLTLNGRLAFQLSAQLTSCNPDLQEPINATINIDIDAGLDCG